MPNDADFPGRSPGSSLAELWEIETAGHVRRATLHPHPEGFEVRIVDPDGVTVESQTFASEPEAEAFAQARRHALLAGGMAEDPDTTPER